MTMVNGTELCFFYMQISSGSISSCSAGQLMGEGKGEDRNKRHAEEEKSKIQFWNLHFGLAFGNVRSQQSCSQRRKTKELRLIWQIEIYFKSIEYIYYITHYILLIWYAYCVIILQIRSGLREHSGRGRRAVDLENRTAHQFRALF